RGNLGEGQRDVPGSSGGEYPRPGQARDADVARAGLERDLRPGQSAAGDVPGPGLQGDAIRHVFGMDAAGTGGDDRLLAFRQRRVEVEPAHAGDEAAPR